MQEIKIKDLKKGDWFTLKPIENPKESQVYIRDTFCREEKKYICCKWDDINTDRLFKGDKVVYIGFTF